MWECFCDRSYYDKWAVRNTDDKSFHSVIHVGTPEEAEFLVERLNDCNELRSKLETIKCQVKRLYTKKTFLSENDADRMNRGLYKIIKECE